MSEWFHIRQWQENRKKVWCLFDCEGNMLIDNVDRYTAMTMQEELKAQSIKTQIVSKHHDLYDEIARTAKRKHKHESN